MMPANAISGVRDQYLEEGDTELARQNHAPLLEKYRQLMNRLRQTLT